MILPWIKPCNGLPIASTLQPKLLTRTVGPDGDHRHLCFSLYPHVIRPACPFSLSLSITPLQAQWVLTVSQTYQVFSVSGPLHLLFLLLQIVLLHNFTFLSPSHLWYLNKIIISSLPWPSDALSITFPHFIFYLPSSHMSRKLFYWFIFLSAYYLFLHMWI